MRFWFILKNRCLYRWLLAAAVCLVSFSASAWASDQPLWFSKDSQGDLQVHLYFFWSERCLHCREARPFIEEELVARYPWLVLHSYNLLHHPEGVGRYREMAAQFGRKARSVPAFFFCHKISTGYHQREDSGAFLERALKECWQQQRSGADSTPAALTEIYKPITLPLLGEINLEHYSLPVYTVIIAGLDAFNPCAFFVLLFLLSVMVRAKSRRRMLFIGGLFVFFSGFIYFLFMSAWLNLFLIIGQWRVITLIAGLVALLFALINIKDFFVFKQGVSLSIPKQAKSGLIQRMYRMLDVEGIFALSIATIVLALAVNSYELLCTAGFPMVYTRMLTLQQLPLSNYYLYLLFYNVIYVIPMLVIVVAFTVTMGQRKLMEHEGRLLKLASGLMMLGLGLMLLLIPDQLNNPIWLAMVLVIAIAVSALLYVRSKPV